MFLLDILNRPKGRIVSVETIMSERKLKEIFCSIDDALEDTHNPHQLHTSWSAVEPLLRRTGLCIEQSSSGKAPRFPTVKLPSEKIVRQSILGTGQGINP